MMLWTHRSFLSLSFLLLPFLSFARPQAVAHLKGLDKVTGRVFEISAPIDQSVTFGTLEITVRHCDQTPEEAIPETSVFLEIKEKKENAKILLFSSWMFASSPGISALEHPTYDVWVSPRQSD